MNRDEGPGNIIMDNVSGILAEIPEHVALVAAAKSRNSEEIGCAIDAGIEIIGQNYVQEAEKTRAVFGGKVKWHFIGHLQKNKVKKAVELFDMIETLDSLELARALSERCRLEGKRMPVLIEVNSGSEPQKSGMMPGGVERLVKDVSKLETISVSGLMTMGPFTSDQETLRACFRCTAGLFKKLKDDNIPGIEMKYLSMGMSDSYMMAIEEGANLVRVGTGIFGERKQ